MTIIRKLRWKRIFLMGGMIFCVTIFILFVQKYAQPQKEREQQIKTEPQEPKMTVVIDPGHGGIDAGANREQLYEKDIALNVAKVAGDYLEKRNVKVVYTREEDKNLHKDKETDLKMRALLSAEHQADYFVSVHVNDFYEDISGFEIYTKDEDSQVLAQKIGKHIDNLMYSKNRGLYNGSNLLVLKDNTVPSVLVEIGYINGKDFQYLKDGNSQNDIGEAIAKGILEE